MTVAEETGAAVHDAAAELASVRASAAAVAVADAEQDAIVSPVRVVKRSRASEGAPREPHELRTACRRAR